MLARVGGMGRLDENVADYFRAMVGVWEGSEE